MFRIVPPTIFPNLLGARWAYTNLNAEALRDPAVNRTFNPLNEPDFCDTWVKQDARTKGADFSYGGYMEPRDFLWRGHYHNPQSMRHTAVDYNIPAGTPVCAPANSTVLRTVRDTSYGGWGGCVFLQLENPYGNAPYYLMAHLAHEGLPEAEQSIQRGEMVGRIGQPHENGVWFPHLHLQCFSRQVHNTHAPALEGMDGYGPNTQVVNADMPDPTALGAGMHR